MCAPVWSATMGSYVGVTCDAPGRVLTQRQLEVLNLAVNDRSAKEIAQWLSISVRTVEGHLANLRRVAGVSTLQGLTAWAVATGLARPVLNGVGTLHIHRGP